jgi:hypothetical protein
MKSIIVRIVDFCARFRWLVLFAGTLLLFGAAAFDLKKFSINTDVDTLIQSLPWHRRQVELSNAFPQTGISVVVSAPTAERGIGDKSAGGSSCEESKAISPCRPTGQWQILRAQ